MEAGCWQDEAAVNIAPAPVMSLFYLVLPHLSFMNGEYFAHKPA